MLLSWAGNKVAMWRTADPHTGVQIPPRPSVPTGGKGVNRAY